MYWAVYVRNIKLIDILLLAENVSPFTIAVDGKSPFHLACLKGDIVLVDFFVSSIYKELKSDKIISKSSFIDIQSPTTYETGLHAALKHKKYEVAHYLILKDANPSTFNYRGWKPFESHINTQIKKIEHIWRSNYKKYQLKQTSITNIEEVEKIMFTQYRSGYQFVMVCVMDKPRIQDCIIYKQFENI
jgi:Ankyrin repeats (3 copies)